mgnify:FL=1
MKNSSSEIRSKFINYFTAKGHTYVDSSPILPPNDDKTLLFTNAGMVQFKDIFLGLKDSKFKSAVTSQKCIRAGGKHNDLDNVGFTNRHHTFFEMLGNFSFGDYFKEEAIKYAWDFLTLELNIPKDKLWITVHDTDLEAKNIWINEIGINENRLSIIGTSDNFWSMGDVGPCGPCTEIFYDYGDKYNGMPPGQGDEGERYVEIWNLVFMQFNRLSKDKIIELPKPSVDTGMGLERICAVMQNEHSNYSTDLFAPMIDFIKNSVDKKYISEISSMQVIADHIRSISFLITEDVRPSNEGHGYVLRRIIRRAIRHSQKINLDSKKLLEIIPIFIDTLVGQYKEVNKYDYIKKTLSLEIDKFSETLEVGLEILDKNIKKIISNGSKKEISGDLLFLLYDTYGFPIDLTSTIANEKKFKVDIDSFDKLMEQQKINSKKSSKFETQNFIDIKTKHVTDFTGYSDYKNNIEVLDIYIEGENSNTINFGESACIIINPCPFYAESGGQIGDSGVIASKNGEFEVIDTKKLGAASLLYGKQTKGFLKINDKANAEINKEKRDCIKLNHSATHLLHAALIKNIGNNVQQKGSLVSDTKLRFDFSCEKPIKRKVLNLIEEEVNNNIEKNITADTKLMGKEEAISKGAMALFGEKYDDEVRVLSFSDVSIELCGGTHVKSTGDIGVFKILSESSVSSGVRRIEAITGMSANNYLTKRDNLVTDVCQILNVHDEELKNKVNVLLDDNKKLKKENLNLLKNFNKLKILEIISNKNLQDKFNVQVIFQEYFDGKALKNVLEDIKSSEENLILTIIQKNKSKVEIYTLVTKDCFNFITAKEIINSINDNIGSTGGGRDDLAQAGLEYKDNIENLTDIIRNNISEVILNKGK